MKILAAFLLIILSLQANASLDFAKQLQLYASLMNKKELTTSDMEALNRSYRFGEDRAFFNSAQMRKRFFVNSDWQVKSLYHSLFLMFRGNSMLRIDLQEHSREVVINGQAFNLNADHSVWSQVKPLFRSKPVKTSSRFSLFIPAAEAAGDSNTNPQQQFVVASLVLGSTQFEQNGFNSLIPGDSAGAQLLSFNGQSISGGGILLCSNGKASGEINITIDDSVIPAHFVSSLEGDGPDAKLVTKLSLFTNPEASVSQTVSAKEDLDSKPLACALADMDLSTDTLPENFQIYLDNIRDTGFRHNAPLREQIEQFRLARRVLTGGAYAGNSIVANCASETSDLTVKSVHDCLLRLCNGKSVIFTLAQNNTSDDFDYGRFSKTLRQSMNRRDEAYAALRREMSKQNVQASDCLKPGDFCFINNTDPSTPIDTKVDALSRSYQDANLNFMNQSSNHTRAISQAFDLAQASTACCNQESCKSKFNNTRKSTPADLRQ